MFGSPAETDWGCRAVLESPCSCLQNWSPGLGLCC